METRLVEKQEDRTLLTVVSTFDGLTGTLTVSIDAADNVMIDSAIGQVKINGADPDSGVLFAEEVSTINVTAVGDFPNVIDLRNVDSSVFGGVTAVTLKGGAGDDEIFAPRIDSLLQGEDGNDTLHSSDGNDTIDGGLGNDRLLVRGGNDTVSGGAGLDTIDFSTTSAEVTFDLDLITNLQSLNVSDGVMLSDVIENVIGSSFSDIFRADFLPSGTARLIQGGDPTAVPGDQLIVDFQNQPGGYTMRGVGRGAYRILSSSFGQINFESIEAPTAENVTTVNLTLQPDVPAGPYRMTREGEDTKFYNVENDIYGGMEHDQIQFVEFIGADFVDDEFIVDMSAGSLVVPGGIHVSGGDGGNDIATIIGDAGSDFLYTPSATTFGSGDVIGRVDSFFLTFEGLEPVYVSASVTGNVGMEPSNTDDVIAIATLARLPQFA